jgi:tRNA(fMet)-specific endonuclease VapC
MQLLIDTHIVSEVMRMDPDQNVLRKWESNHAALAISATTWHELLFGIARMPSSERRRQKEAFLVELSCWLPILSYDQAAANWHAFERARLMTAGKTPAYLDGQIAAVAVVNQLTLVTASVADFKHFKGLELVNWIQRK